MTNIFQWTSYQWLVGLNSSPSGQNGRHFTDDVFKCIFVHEKFCISIKISVKFVPKGPIDNNLALAWIMAWRRIVYGVFSVSSKTYFAHRQNYRSLDWSMLYFHEKCYCKKLFFICHGDTSVNVLQKLMNVTVPHVYTAHVNMLLMATAVTAMLGAAKYI